MLGYLDSASIAPPAPEALAAMQRALGTAWGHPGALHSVGGRSLHALDVARQQVAEYLGVTAPEIVFTAGGREALSLGLELAAARSAGTIVSSTQEHPSVHVWIAQSGRAAEWLAMPAGAPSAEDVARASGAGILVLSACNHELGTTPWPALRAATTGLRVVDAVQAAPWVSLEELNDDRTFYVISGPKLGAPLGIGVLRVPPHVYYAERERGRTLESASVPWLLAIGLGAVCDARVEARDEALLAARAKASALVEKLRAVEPRLVRNGDEGALLGPIVNLSFPGRPARALVSSLSLENVCIAHTAACRSRDEDMSPVVRAAYPTEPARAPTATRWSVTEHTTDADLDYAAAAFARIVALQRVFK